MGSIEPNLSALTAFLSTRPHIQYATPLSPNYSSLRSSYIVDDSIEPTLIVRPRSATDIAELVPLLAANAIPFTIRSGGHDMFSRSFATGTVTIDMRDIAFVKIDKESRSARIGGGILIQDVVDRLAKEGFVTTTGTIPVVGYVGWATHGGYGILSPNFGLGADQILGATIVTASGEMVDADEELLKGIRGGGGAFGVIVELTIRVYPLDKVLGGLILYQSDNIAATIKQYNDGYRALSAKGLPPALGTHQAVINSPADRAFGLLFLWSSSDIAEGELWLKKLCSLAPVAMHTVTTTTVADWLRVAGTVVPDRCHGPILSLNLRRLTPEVVDVIAAHAQRMPADPASMFGIHELRGPATEDGKYADDSVFPERSAHFMFEILPTVKEKKNLAAALAWAQPMHEALAKTDPENLLPTLYLPFVGPEKVDATAIYREHHDTLVRLKQKYDPDNVFRFALAQV